MFSFSVLVLGGRKDGKDGKEQRERRRKVEMIVESRVYAGMGSSLVREVVCSMLVRQN